MMERLVSVVGVASVGAFALSMHSCLNAILVRRPTISTATVPRLGESGVLRDGVTVCIPARNEASTIEACIQAVLANRGLTDLRVVVLDDGSTDDTRSIALAAATSDTRVRIIDGGNALLPDGWIGKTWACERLLGSVETSVVVFVDADVRLGPDALVAGVQLLRGHSLSLVSPYPKQLVGSWVERLVQPLLQWLWLTFLPLRLAERSTSPSLTAANGQFMVLDTNALRSIDGFQSVAGEVLDDVALARSLKRSGFRATVAEGSALATCRMYDGWVTLRDGYTKNLWSATGSPLGAAGMIAMFFGLYILPVLGIVSGLLLVNAQLLVVSLGGYAAGVLGRLVSARTTGGSARDAVFHPVSIAILVWLIVRSWRKHRRGAITWKGRSL